jgi:ATP-binding cassette subfamily B multidrug efflux pump
MTADTVSTPTPSGANVLSRFLRTYATRHLRSYGLGFLFLLATTGLTVAVPAMVERAVDAMGAGEPSDVRTWAAMIVGAGLVVMVVRTLSRVLFFNPGRVIEYDLKSDLFAHLLTLKRGWFDRMRPGDIVSRGTNDAAAVRGFIGFGSLQVFNVVLLLVLTLGQMFLTNPTLTAVCIVPLTIAALVLRHGVRRLFALTSDYQKEIAALSSRALEAYGGMPILQSFGAVPVVRERFIEGNARLLGVSEATAAVQSWILPIVDVVGNLCLVLLLFVGGRMIEDRDLTPGELAAFAGYIRIVAGGLTSLGWLVNALQRGWISLRRLYEIIDAPSGRPTSDVAVERPSGAPSISVRGLTFRYPAPPDGAGPLMRERPPALVDVSLELRAGRTLGVFGETGSGKSTLLQLVARIYEAPRGTVFIDGVDVLDLEPRSWWRRTAWVSQEPWLFSQSLRDNIALADDPDSRPEGRVERSAALAALSDDVATFPEGFETRVGERGVTLSGGQRQRAALARAFYRDFDLLLLDDVLSAVDHATEKRLIDAIYAERKDATMIFVSHRVSALRHADHIVVFEGGRIVAEGTHATLLADTQGPYYRAWRLQQARDAEGGARDE